MRDKNNQSDSNRNHDSEENSNPSELQKWKQKEKREECCFTVSVLFSLWFSVKVDVSSVIHFSVFCKKKERVGKTADKAGEKEGK